MKSRNTLSIFRMIITWHAFPSRMKNIPRTEIRKISRSPSRARPQTGLSGRECDLERCHGLLQLAERGASWGIAVRFNSPEAFFLLEESIQQMVCYTAVAVTGGRRPGDSLSRSSHA